MNRNKILFYYLKLELFYVKVFLESSACALILKFCYLVQIHSYVFKCDNINAQILLGAVVDTCAGNL